MQMLVKIRARQIVACFVSSPSLLSRPARMEVCHSALCCKRRSPNGGDQVNKKQKTANQILYRGAVSLPLSTVATHTPPPLNRVLDKGRPHHQPPFLIQMCETASPTSGLVFYGG